MRRVRTPEGSRYYDLPIGAPITADALSRARSRWGSSSSSAAPGRGSSSSSGPTPAKTSSKPASGASGVSGAASPPSSSPGPSPDPSAGSGGGRVVPSPTGRSDVSYRVAEDETVTVDTANGPVALDEALADQVLSRIYPESADVPAAAAGGRGAGTPSGAPTVTSPDASGTPSQRRAQAALDSPSPQTGIQPGQVLANPEEATDALLAKAAEVEPQITEDMTSAAEKFGMDMLNLDFRLKGRGSLLRKMSDESRFGGMTPNEAVGDIKDAVRYTMTTDEDTLVEKMTQVLEEFRRLNYQMDVKNTWKPGSEYKGVNVAMTRPDGYMFELQFHTPTSAEVKEVNHELYEEARLLSKDDPQYENLRAKMAENAEQIPTPPGIEDFTG